MAAFGRRQKGNVTRAQLLAAGFSATVIDRRAQRGSLHARFPGVYLVGHEAEPPLSRECAALLYCGPRTMLSHRTASRVTDLPTPPFDAIEVTVVGRRHRPRDGLIVYSIDAIEPHELRRHRGLPITSPSLTLLDLAGRVTRDELARALNEARVQDQVSDGELAATLGAHPNRRGARALRELLRSEEAEFVVESEAERSVPRAHDRAWPEARRRRGQDRSIPRRLPLRVRAADRGSRRLPVSPNQAALRPRPPPSRSPDGARLRDLSDHLGGFGRTTARRRWPICEPPASDDARTSGWLRALDRRIDGKSHEAAPFLG